MRRALPLSRIQFSVSPDWNLNATEVETRRIQYGNNDIVEVHGNRFLELAIDTAKDPMIWFLIITSALFAILKNYNQSIILMLATIPLICMDAFLLWRTQVSTQSLSSRLSTNATVIRDQLEITIPAWQIVPGDLVVVSTGTPFPADGIVIAGKNLQVDESALTGESYPVQKKILENILKDIKEPLINSDYWGFAGTRLLTGRALLRVVYTGKESLYGEIVTSTLQSTHARTPLQKEIAKLVFTLIIAATVFCFILAGVRYYQGFGLIDAILSAATLAVAALPDEFPVVFTFFLGVGVYRLAKKKALVKHAVSVENIGRITYICSDKTGTITEGRFQLARYFCAPSFDDNTLLSLALLASHVESGDLLDLAIFDEAESKKISMSKPIHTFPFTEDRKRETAILAQDNQFFVATKGAPETILALSTLSQDEKKLWMSRISELATSGYKVIACAEAIIEKTAEWIEPQQHYKFAGLLAFSDPPRKGVFDAIQQCRESKIHVLMITGDHPETARTIAREIGLGQGTPNVVLAQDIEQHLKNNDINFLKNVDVVARTVPSQKLDIVKMLQLSGEIVAVTGDGVNDVPALKAADIGVAMGERGTQSAREVSDIVLLDDNFDSIVNAIAEGRQLFKNLKLSFKYLLMVHFPFVMSAALIPLLGYPLLYYPIHIVLIELIIHPTSMLVFQDLPTSQKLDVVVRQKKHSIFINKDWLKILIIGIFTTSLVVLSFIFILRHSMSLSHARAFAFASLFFTSGALTFGLSGFKTWTTRIIGSLTFISSVLFTQIPTLAKFLSLTPLHINDWFIIVVASMVTFILVKNES